MNSHVGPGSLTPFQCACEAALLEILRRQGYDRASRSVEWIGEPALRYIAGDVEVWIFLDGAEITASDNWRFEKYDYRSPELLINAYADKLRAELSRMGEYLVYPRPCCRRVAMIRGIVPRESSGCSYSGP